VSESFGLFLRKSYALLVCYVENFLSGCNSVHAERRRFYCNFSVMQPVLQMDKSIVFGVFSSSINLVAFLLHGSALNFLLLEITLPVLFCVE